jgi:hypothetical protein
MIMATEGLVLVIPLSAACGRKNCTKCGRWRHLCDFPYEVREDRSCVYIKSECYHCARARRRAWYAGKLPSERARYNRYTYLERVAHLNGNPLLRVDAWPVRKYLLERLEDGDTMEVLAFELNMDPRHVEDLARGYHKVQCGYVPIRTVTRNVVAHILDNRRD